MARELQEVQNLGLKIVSDLKICQQNGNQTNPRLENEIRRLNELNQQLERKLSWAQERIQTLEKRLPDLQEALQQDNILEKQLLKANTELVTSKESFLADYKELTKKSEEIRCREAKLLAMKEAEMEVVCNWYEAERDRIVEAKNVEIKRLESAWKKWENELEMEYHQDRQKKEAEHAQILSDYEQRLINLEEDLFVAKAELDTTRKESTWKLESGSKRNFPNMKSSASDPASNKTKRVSFFNDDEDQSNKRKRNHHSTTTTTTNNNNVNVNFEPPLDGNGKVTNTFLSTSNRVFKPLAISGAPAFPQQPFSTARTPMPISSKKKTPGMMKNILAFNYNMVSVSRPSGSKPLQRKKLFSESLMPKEDLP